MKEEQYAFDFSVLPEGLDLHAPLSNITDCLACDDLDRILHFAVGEAASRLSAYERFRLLARTMPDLFFHPFKDHTAHLLKQAFSIDDPLTIESCDRIWQESAAILSFRRKDLGSLLSELTSTDKIGIACSPKNFSDLTAYGLSPVLNGGDLLVTDSKSWNDWENEITDIFLAFRDAGSQSVVFSVPKAYRFVRPDRYHTEEALLARSTDEKGKNVLISQCLRQLCILCRERGSTLILHAEGDVQETLALIRFFEKGIGLPDLLLTAANEKDLYLCADYASEAHGATVRCGIFLSDYPSEVELWNAISLVSARYPFGYLQFMSAVDPRFSAPARKRLENLLNKHL